MVIAPETEPSENVDDLAQFEREMVTISVLECYNVDTENEGMRTNHGTARQQKNIALNYARLQSSHVQIQET